MTEKSRFFIYCNDPSHETIIPVENFELFNFAGESEDWTPVRRTRGKGRDWNRVEPHTSIVDDEPLRDAFMDKLSADVWRASERADLARSIADVVLDDSRQMRTVYELKCRKCKRPLTLRATTLMPILDRAREAGLTRLSLFDIGYIVETRSRLRNAAEAMEAGHPQTGAEEQA